MDTVPLWIMTAFWAFVGCLLPIAVPAWENRSLIQTMLVITAVCCYIFWLGPFLMQQNPIIGPQLKAKNYWIAASKWNGWEKH